jgi:hypothetical protein
VLKFNHWFWHRDQYSWDRMLEYGWLWYYSRTWWTAAKNRAQRKRLRELSRTQPPAPAPMRPLAAKQAPKSAQPSRAGAPGKAPAGRVPAAEKAPLA